MTNYYTASWDDGSFEREDAEEADKRIAELEQSNAKLREQNDSLDKKCAELEAKCEMALEAFEAAEAFGALHTTPEWPNDWQQLQINAIAKLREVRGE